MPRPPPCHNPDPGMQARVPAPESLGPPRQPSTQPEGKRAWQATLAVPPAMPRGTTGLYHADRRQAAAVALHPRPGDVGMRSGPGGPRSALPTTRSTGREDGGHHHDARCQGRCSHAKHQVRRRRCKIRPQMAQNRPTCRTITADAGEEEGWCRWRVEAGRGFRQNSF